MMFQKNVPKPTPEMPLRESEPIHHAPVHDEVETVVGPSVNVEGDFASEGNIVVKGTVAGSVHTSRNLAVEPGAKITANVRAGSASIAGEIKGNMKIKETLTLASTARVMGDIEVKVLVIEAGALVFGRIQMPGLESSDPRNQRASRLAPKRNDEAPLSV